MSVPALDLYQVLEEEYVSMYGELPIAEELRDGTITVGDIADFDSAARTYTSFDAATFATKGALAARLDWMRQQTQGKQCPARFFRTSPQLSHGTVQMMRRYDSYAPAKGAPDPRLLINRRILDEVFVGSLRSLRDRRIANVYDHLHARAHRNPDQARTALSISGGGIRSATFALGVIQGMASAKVLHKFDYLSTVSGGGYIGSWLSSWIRRDGGGVGAVERSLREADSGTGQVRELPARLEPEPQPVRHLREYSNYLSPRLGILSGDAWTMAAMYIRNLVLNWLVLIPLLAGVLALPRVFTWALVNVEHIPLAALVWSTLVPLAMAFFFVGALRPVKQGSRADMLRRIPWLRGWSRDSRVMVGIVLPLTASAFALTLFWARAAADQTIWLEDVVMWIGGIGLVVAMIVLPVLTYFSRYVRTPFSARREPTYSVGSRTMILRPIVEVASAIFSAVVAAGLLYLLAVKVFDTPTAPPPITPWMPPYLRPLMPSSAVAELYICLAVPLVLLVSFVQASIFVGFSNRYNHDYDREWWGRAGAWVLAIATLWAAVCAIAIYGPVLIHRAPTIIASLGGVAGLVSILLGRSAATPANPKQKAEAGAAAKASNLALGLAVPFFVVFFLAAISFATTWVIQRVRGTEPPTAEWAYAGQFQSTMREQMPTVKGTLTNTTPAAPLVEPEVLHGAVHLMTVHETDSRQALAFLGVFVIGLALSWPIGVNRFSMHALYRNRLIRAYLGASRWSRDPDPFTGFDPHDNLRMADLRPELLWVNSFRDTDDFLDIVRGKEKKGNRLQHAVAAHLRRRFHRTTRFLLGDDWKAALFGSTNSRHDVIGAVFQDLNRCIDSDVDLRCAVFGVGADLGPGKPSLAVENRRFLEEVFPNHIARMPLVDESRPADDEVPAAHHLPGKIDATAASIPHRPPLHVVNMALNLVSGEKLAWQQRKAESFTSSPLHSGAPFVGYRNSSEYGEGISLGTAVTISGAAASPNMGYHSSPALAFLLTMFNVRLGWWLGNPGPAGDEGYHKSNPTTSIGPLVREALGRTNDEYGWVYLSDGGHFENLGLYEMVLRRCHRIVVSDAACDPGYAFDDLGNAIRKIRTDLGVPIEIDKMYMYPRNEEKQGKYCAVGRIRYSAVDGPKAFDGKFIYVKPGVYADPWFPKDVYNYAKESAEFPHETTADQFFSESQFESYRALGRHVVNEMCGNYYDPATPNARLPIARRFDSVTALIEHVDDHLHEPATIIDQTKALLQKWL